MWWRKKVGNGENFKRHFGLEQQGAVSH